MSKDLIVGARFFAVSAAKWIPNFIKGWVHRHRYVDRLARRTFSRILGLGGDLVTIESGPLTGLRLVVSEHVSHAHIRGIYEFGVQLAIDRLISPSFICYDLGASIGYMSLLMALKARHVYAFEPAPHSAAEIQKHVAANEFRNITIIRSPVSDSVRTVSFGLTDNAYGSCIVETETDWPCLELTTITLDDFVKTHPFPDFVKMDVEGEEGRVLRGARSLLQEKKPLICCELHSAAAAHHVQEILTECGYDLKTLTGAPFRLPPSIVPGEVHLIGLPRALPAQMRV